MAVFGPRFKVWKRVLVLVHANGILFGWWVRVRSALRVYPALRARLPVDQDLIRIRWTLISLSLRQLEGRMHDEVSIMIRLEGCTH